MDPRTISLLSRLLTTCKYTIGDIMTMKRGVLFDKSLLCDFKKTEMHYRYFEGNVYRYYVNIVAGSWVEFGDKMKERPKEFYWFEGSRSYCEDL